MEECKTVQTAWRPRPAQPSCAPPSTPCYIFRQFHADTLKTPDRTSALHEVFKQNCFKKYFFWKFTCEHTPFCQFQSRNHLNLLTLINRPSPQTNLLDTQQGRLCARWCVCVYCLHRPGDSAAAGQSAAAAVDIIVLTFVTLRLGMLS